MGPPELHACFFDRQNYLFFQFHLSIQSIPNMEFEGKQLQDVRKEGLKQQQQMAAAAEAEAATRMVGERELGLSVALRRSQIHIASLEAAILSKVRFYLGIDWVGG